MQKLSSRCAALLALAALAGALLAACAPEPAPEPTETQPPDAAAPLFASDEEALAAAEAAYLAYNEMSNQIVRDGGERAERIMPFVTKSQFGNAEIDFRAIRENRWRGQGGVKVDQIKLQKWRGLEGRTSVTIYLCLDVSDARLFDEAGKDVTPIERAVRTPLVVGFSSPAETETKLIIESSEVWSGDNFC